jgi:ceramide glucosyltransferase
VGFLLHLVLPALALLSLALTLWQWVVARRFPLHQRSPRSSGLAPALTLLKPLKGCDHTTAECLRSWFLQEYQGPVQILFGVASAQDRVCGLVGKLLEEFPAADAKLVVCGPLRGANLKVSKLIELERLVRHELLVISDADVRVPRDFLANSVVALENETGVAPATASPVPMANPAAQRGGREACPGIGLVNCFYRLANPTTVAMRWEAVAINADFWSQVLQAASLKPLDFALGAVMVVRRQSLRDIGGFTALADCLADDYQLGHRIAALGQRLVLSPVVVDCLSPPMRWGAVWRHQLRWARTIRVCQPWPYFFSLLSNASLWPLLWLAAAPAWPSLAFATCCSLVRVSTALNLQHRLTQAPAHLRFAWLVPLKDLLQAALWLLAFVGNRIEWRGERMCLRRDGTLVRG